MGWSNGTIVVPHEDIVVCELEGGSALLDLNSSKYFRLNATAAFIWEAMQNGPIALEEIRERMIERYDVGPERCLEDIKAILTAFENAELIVRDPA